MIGYGISSLRSCCLLSYSKGLFCVWLVPHALWAGPGRTRDNVLVHSLLPVSTWSHDCVALSVCHPTSSKPMHTWSFILFCGLDVDLNLKVVVTVRHSLVSTHLFAPLSVFLPGWQILSIVWVCKEWAQSAQTKHWAAHFKLPDQRCVCVIWASGLQSGYFVKDVHVFSKLCLL